MNDQDRKLLREINEQGWAAWDKDWVPPRRGWLSNMRRNRAPHIRDEKVPTGSLQRLAEEGCVEVETRTVSVWKFGQGEGIPEPTRRSCVEVWAFATDLGDKEAWA